MADRPLQAQQQTLRIPAYDVQETWLGTRSATITHVGQRLVNLVPKINRDTNGEIEYYAEKRPGLSVLSTNVSTIVGDVTSCTPKENLVITQLNDVYVGAWFDYSTSKIYIIQYRPVAGTVVKIGELAATTQSDYIHLSELQIGGVATLGVVWVKYDLSSSAGYYATSAAGVFTAGSLTEIFGTGVAPYTFPPKKSTPEHLTGPMVQMNGTTYVMTQQGKIYNSDLDSITSWNSLGVIQAIAYPDKGIGLCRYKHHIIAFGMDSIEFFNDVGNPSPASPLERTDQAFIKFGCLTPNSFINIDDNLYWLASSSTGTTGLWKLDGYTPTKLSTQFQDLVIQTGYDSYPYSIGLRSLFINGVKNVLINAAQLGWLGSNWANATSGYYPAQTWTMISTQPMLYAIDSNAWWSFVDCTELGARINVSLFPAGLGATQYILKGHASLFNSTGQANTDSEYIFVIYGAQSSLSFVDATHTTADNTNVLSFWCSNELDQGNRNRKTISRVQILAEYMPSTSSGSPVDSNNFLEVTRDGWKDTASFQQRVFSSSDTLYHYYVNNLGSGRSHIFRVIHMGRVPFVFRGIEVSLAQGTH